MVELREGVREKEREIEKEEKAINGMKGVIAVLCLRVVCFPSFPPLQK